MDDAALAIDEPVGVLGGQRLCTGRRQPHHNFRLERSEGDERCWHVCGDQRQVGGGRPVAVLEQAPIVEVALEDQQVRLGQRAAQVRRELCVKEAARPEGVIVEQQELVGQGLLEAGSQAAERGPWRALKCGQRGLQVRDGGVRHEEGVGLEVEVHPLRQPLLDEEGD